MTDRNKYTHAKTSKDDKGVLLVCGKCGEFLTRSPAIDCNKTRINSVPGSCLLDCECPNCSENNCCRSIEKTLEYDDRVHFTHS